MVKILSLFIAILLIIGCSQLSEKTVTFIVYPEIISDTSKIFISGNHERLGSWEANKIPLKREADGSWRISVSFPSETYLKYGFTTGSWTRQAVMANGCEYPHFTTLIVRDTVIVHEIESWQDNFPDLVLLSKDRLRNNEGSICLCRNWRYHPGDNPAWANPDYDDSEWEIVGSLLSESKLPSTGWEGVGWFRLHLTVDSSLWNEPLALQISQMGAAEVFLNGQLLFSIGEVANSAEYERAAWERYPKVIVPNLAPQQLLAVRYSNFAYKKFHEMRHWAGFYIDIFCDANRRISNYGKHLNTLSRYQMLFTVFPVALAILHFLLFVFYPQSRENLFFALCMLGWAGMVFLTFHTHFTSSALENITYARFGLLVICFAAIFGVLTAYAIVYQKFPKQYLAFIIMGCLLTTFGFFASVNKILDVIVAVFLFITTLEILRVFLFPGKKEKKRRWIIAFGFMVLMISLVYQMLIVLRIAAPLGEQGVVYIYGLVILAVAVSIDLSRNYAKTHRNLETKLVEVKNLSEKNLEQERRFREEEIARRILEADNSRKTKELEEARKLQLAMLPRNIPQIPHLEIAVHMETASEVGGDYYDFHYSENGTLTIAIGDATGHGMRAGTLVASVKSLFGAFGGQLDIPEFFRRCTKIIRGMNLGNLYMAMQVARIENHSISMAAAGMPPAMIYRHSSGEVEEVLIKGFPLGGAIDFEYQQKKLNLAAGDIVLFMTDGYPELFNEQEEMLDYHRVKKIFTEACINSTQDVMRYLINAGKKWQKNQQLADDITFVMIKVLQ